jgi:hypothetical protein
LRAWVEADLKASSACWKFVCIHQPPFTHDPIYSKEQSTRVLCDIFQENAVNIVFSGHSHAYERHHPLRFHRHPVIADDPEKVGGNFELDLSFDGRTNTSPTGVIYVVSGAGVPAEKAKTNKLPPFLAKRIEGVRSFTLCDVSGDTATIKQVADDGRELDRWILRK